MVDYKKYELLHTWKNKLKEKNYTEIEINKFLAEYKHNLRQSNKSYTYNETRTVYRADFDDVIIIETLPIIIDDIEEYINDNWVSINSAYDCTGKWFTRWIKVIPIKAMHRTIVLHCMSIDC